MKIGWDSHMYGTSMEIEIQSLTAALGYKAILIRSFQPRTQIWRDQKDMNVTRGLKTMHLLCLLEFVAKYEETSTTALSANPTVTVPLLTINGWILMQRKVTGGAVSFNQNWAEYRDGFGSAAGNDSYWLGLDKVYRLVQLGSVRLRVEVN